MISVTEHPEYIGFTLPTTSVSSKVIPIGSDVIFVNLYSFTLCLLYAISICLLTVWYYLPSSAAKETIDALINQNAELSMGIRITSSTALALEFITRLATCIVWTLNIENPLGILLAVWMPQIHLFIMAAVQIVFVTTYICYHSEGGYQVGSALRTFSNLCATTFTLFYLLFPTIILMFAYPTQIIVIFTFVTAYLFATTIFSASIVKLYNKFNPPKEDDHGQQTKKDFNEHENTDKEEPQKKTCCTCDFKSCRSKISEAWHDFKNDWKNIVKEKLKKFLKKLLVLIFFITLWLIIIYLHFLVVFASYSMLIGRGSVINTGPLFLISLLPSAVLSGGAWIAKRVALKGPEQTTESEGEEKIANKEHTQSKENGISNGTESAHQTLEMEAVSPINDMSQISHANGNGIQSQDTKI